MKITIITVCYNSAETIDSAIKSVIEQSYTDIEYIIIDGSSDDDTLKIINNYSHRISYIVSERDKGIYDAMNKGISLASGDVIAILNSDDFYLNNAVIADVIKFFLNNDDLQIVIGNVDFVLPKSLTVSIRLYSSLNFKPWKMRFGFMPAHPATFIRRSTYEKVGKYNCNYKIAGDFEWFVRAFLVYDIPFIALNKTFVRMRKGGVSSSGLKSYLTSSQEQLMALRLNKIYSNILFVLFRLPLKFFLKYIKQ